MPAFQTTYGDKIPLLDRFSQMFRVLESKHVVQWNPSKLSPRKTGGPTRWLTDLILDRQRKVAIEKYHAFSFMTDFLHDRGVPLSFEHHLDIGSAHAIQSQLFKAAGYSERAVCLDLYQGVDTAAVDHLLSALPDIYRRHQLARTNGNEPSILGRPHDAYIRRAMPTLFRINQAPTPSYARFSRALPDPDSSVPRFSTSDVIEEGIRLKKTKERLQRNAATKTVYRLAERLDRDRSNYLREAQLRFGYFPASYKLKLDRDHSIDEYLVSDFYELRDSYDLITSFLTIEYFNVHKFLKKIHALLRKNGVFCFVVSYWWYPENATRIVGHFPFVCQRLDRSDFVRYLKEFHAADHDDLISMYDAFYPADAAFPASPVRPTIDDFVQGGARNGMECIGVARIGPLEHFHTDLGDWYHTRLVAPTVLHRFEGSDLASVIANVNRYNPSVTVEDLNTSHVMLAFRKP